MKLGIYCYSTDNLGDEIQSIAARQFIPKGEKPILINRDFPSHKTNEQVFLIANGWLSESYLSFFIPENIQPFFISIHIQPKMELTAAMIDTLKKAEPVGCRDHYTFERLKRAGVDCFFSGCLTLTLGRSYRHQGGGRALRNDVPEEVLAKYFPSDLKPQKVSQHMERLPLTCFKNRFSMRIINKRSRNQLTSPAYLTIQERISSFCFNSGLFSHQDKKRFSTASQLLQTYESADLIITSRLHAVLPAIAMGTPVFFAPKIKDDVRFTGYEFLKHFEKIRPDVSDWARSLAEIMEKAVEKRENPLRDHHGRKLIEALTKSQRK